MIKAPNFRFTEVILNFFFSFDTYAQKMGDPFNILDVHIQIPPDWLRRSHITQYQFDYGKLEYLWGNTEGTLPLLLAQ